MPILIQQILELIPPTGTPISELIAKLRVGGFGDGLIVSSIHNLKVNGAIDLDLELQNGDFYITIRQTVETKFDKLRRKYPGVSFGG